VSLFLNLSFIPRKKTLTCPQQFILTLSMANFLQVSVTWPHNSVLSAGVRDLGRKMDLHRNHLSLFGAGSPRRELIGLGIFCTYKFIITY
jgi:hypothetical protein